ELAAVGYVVDQTPQLAQLPDEPRPGAMEDAPPLGPFRTFQAPIRDIAELTGLDLDQLIAVDRMPIAATLGTAKIGSTWRKLGDVEDLDLDFDLEEWSYVVMSCRQPRAAWVPLRPRMPTKCPASVSTLGSRRDRYCRLAVADSSEADETGSMCAVSTILYAEPKLTNFMVESVVISPPGEVT
ncbi:hypothetical protein, partial [Bacillus mobilis]|uniref:hypothetical protein n=1 Tax=Bacillus mobilis TaxID=2026190 RepID=UPI0036445106